MPRRPSRQQRSTTPDPTPTLTPSSPPAQTLPARVSQTACSLRIPHTPLRGRFAPRGSACREQQQRPFPFFDAPATHLHLPSCATPHSPAQRAGSLLGFVHNWGSSHTHTQDSPPSDQQVHSKVPLRRAVDAVQRWRVGCVRAGRQRRESGTTRKQPANLEVEGAEEFLTILPDYTPTVRPPPKRS
jgi:hypothetical protein